MEERLRLVARLLDGEGMSEVCRSFGISRKTGYNIYNHCYPLTVTDQASRFLMLCEALESTKEADAFEAFRQLFGERIQPGQPQQNGRHERMHLTLKRETTRPPGGNILQQQGRFDAFVKEFNTERPHEVLAMQCPGERYIPSRKPYQGLPELAYPFHDKELLVTCCGRICMHRKKVNISTVMAGQRVGLKEVDDAIWLVSFMHYDLGYIDVEQRTLQTIDNPFGAKL